MATWQHISPEVTEGF